MKLRLLNSGLDLLKAAVVYYKRFLSLNGTDELGLQDYLRLCIVSLHGSIELLSKKLLSDLNELLIYRDISQPVLENLNSYLSKGENNNSLHYDLILGEKRVSPIDYLESIIRLKQLYQINDNNFRVLQELDRIKNKVYYFGFDQASDYYEVIRTINQSLIFVQAFFYPKFSQREEMDISSDYLADALSHGRIAEEKIWETSNSKKLKQLHRLLSHICLELNIEIKGSQVRLDIENADAFDDHNITIFLRHIDNGKVLTKVKTLILMEQNALLFSGNFFDGPVYFIIDYSGSKETLFIYDPPLQLPNFKFIPADYWKRDGKSLEIKYGFENLKKVLFYIFSLSIKNNFPPFFSQNS